jgi:hypothetical protein
VQTYFTFEKHLSQYPERESQACILQAQSMGEEASTANGPDQDRFIQQLTGKVWGCADVMQAPQ